MEISDCMRNLDETKTNPQNEDNETILISSLLWLNSIIVSEQ